MDDKIKRNYTWKNNHEIQTLADNRFKSYMVLIFSDSNKAQIYKKPHRDSVHPEIGIQMNFKNLNLFQQYEHTEDYHIRKPNDKIFYSKLKIKKIIMWEKN